MLYRLLYFPSKLALWIYGKKITINKPAFLQEDGPLLIAANHPNSFLDAILLASIFKRPIYSLARGDVFTKPFYRKLLASLKMFPVYRLSEGAENLENNYETFDNCIELFKKNSIVLIFSEGLCINEWRLRPLKKGTARLAYSSWQQGIPLRVLPTGINYHSFKSFGKKIGINFGPIITSHDIPLDDVSGKVIQSFNEKLNRELKPLVWKSIEEKNEQLNQELKNKNPTWFRTLLFIPAVAGYITHAPLYLLARTTALKLNGKECHYDSLLIGFLFIGYPIYLLILFILLLSITGSLGYSSLVMILPLLAKAYTLYKKD